MLAHADKFSTKKPMKISIAVLLLLLAVLTACGPKVVGHVTEDLKLQFNDGVIGACVFDNQPVAGDKVVMTEAGLCHDVK